MAFVTRPELRSGRSERPICCMVSLQGHLVQFCAAVEPAGPLACMCASKRTQGVSTQGAQKRSHAACTMPLQIPDLLQTRFR